jgi:hypothetical protein
VILSMALKPYPKFSNSRNLVIHVKVGVKGFLNFFNNYFDLKSIG